MWMVDGNDHLMDGRKLRPLMPRPNSKINISPYSNPSCSCIRNPNILQWTHPMSDYGVRREVSSLPLVSTRWNPTPEQLQALEEMYRRGIRTPSAEQIQQIASKLRRFGKIEGKNVFYWFQNHKARERQKKRRQLAANNIHHNLGAGLSRRCIEIEHHNKLAKPTPTPTPTPTPSEEMQAAAGGWTQLHHKILTAENEPSSALSPNPNNSSLNTLTAHKSTVPHQYILLPNFLEKENRTTTLQLFPVHESGGSSAREHQTLHGTGNKFGASEFIEFLPTKH